MVTGATGYIGGRLVPELLAAGHPVRVMTRNPDRIRDHPWASQAEVARADATDAAQVAAACNGVDVVYYLIHALGAGPEFEETDRRTAGVMAEAAHAAGVGRLVHLGALRIQPIAVRDALRYLVGSATLPADVHRCFDIGGPDVLDYAEMMQRYAEVAGLPRRRILPVPLLSPSLSSHWVGLITPVPAGIARPLVESLRNTVDCTEHDIAEYVPDPPEGLLGFDEAVALAVQRVRDSAVATRWASASVPGAPSDPLPTDPDWAGGILFVDDRSRSTTAGPDAVWAVVEGIGGERGWYSFPLAWRVRGLLDRAAGGVGLRRGRRNPDRLYVGDALDFWRVEEVERRRLLRLRAEKRRPGLAWLEFHVEHDTDGGTTTLRQRATFAPHGLAGHAYWRSIAVFHGFVFGGMIRGLTREAEQRS